MRARISASVFQRYEYDAANRLVRVTNDARTVTLASYTYGDTNQRIVAEEGGARTYYAADGGQVLAEYTEYGTVGSVAKIVFKRGRSRATHSQV